VRERSAHDENLKKIFRLKIAITKFENKIMTYRVVIFFERVGFSGAVRDKLRGRSPQDGTTTA
jgi:hypothetical protein